VSLFQPAGNESESGSDAPSEPDTQKTNSEWAMLALQLDDLKLAAGSGKGKAKKGKSNGVVLETPEMRRLKDRITCLEKEYMFSRKEAGT
jgi:ATP-dependent RNA helicase DHX29